VKLEDETSSFSTSATGQRDGHRGVDGGVLLAGNVALEGFVSAGDSGR